MDILDLIKVALAYVGDESHCHGITRIVAADQVSGERQDCDCEHFDHEFVDQRSHYEDNYYGTVYLPLPNGEYMALDYSA
jgi:hypothetical protein